jgi:hypothetical protein
LFQLLVSLALFIVGGALVLQRRLFFFALRRGCGFFSS